MSARIRMNIYCRQPGGGWELLETAVADRNGEPISEPWSANELLDTLDNYVQSDMGDEWFATLVDDAGRVLVECTSFVR